MKTQKSTQNIKSQKLKQPTSSIADTKPKVSTKPKLKHISLVMKTIKQLESKIDDLKKKKAQAKNKNRTIENVRYIDVPVERIVENQIIEYIDRIVQKQQEIIEYEPIEKVVEVIKQVPKQIWSQRVIVRPQQPQQIITIQVPIIKEVIKYVQQNFDERLYEQVQKQRLHCQDLQFQLETNIKTIQRLKQQLSQLNNS